VLAGALSVDDGVGGHVPLEPIERHGFVVGLRVEDLVLGEPAFDLTVSDLAGNAWKPGTTYPGVTLAPVVEWDEEYVAAEPYWACNQAELLTLEELAGPPPLEGERSLFLDDCTAYFRVQRSAGATTLTFDMRAYAPTTELEVQVRAHRSQRGEGLIDDHPGTAERGQRSAGSRGVGPSIPSTGARRSSSRSGGRSACPCLPRVTSSSCASPRTRDS
jgi:hypothetical protein